MLLRFRLLAFPVEPAWRVQVKENFRVMIYHIMKELLNNLENKRFYRNILSKFLV